MLLAFFLLLQVSEINSVSLDIYVSYNQTNIKCDDDLVDECGSFESPFSSLLQTFYFIDKNSKELSTYDTINIFLTNKTYIIDVFNVTYYLDKLNLANQETEAIWKIFKDLTGPNITILPLNSNVFTTIFLKTLVFSFQLNSLGFLLLNLTVDGKDMDFRRVQQNPDCLFWEIGCCVAGCSSLIVTKYQGLPNFFIEVLGKNSLLVFDRMNFINMNLKKNYITQKVHIDSFIYVNTLLSTFIGISNSKFFKINSKSFLIGSLENTDNEYLNKQLLINFNNSSFDYIDTNLPNSTFRLYVSKVTSFSNCVFNYVKIYINFVGERFFMENCTFLNAGGKSGLDQFYINFQYCYYIVLTNVNFSGGIPTMKFLNAYSGYILLEKIIVNELSYSKENAVLIFALRLKFQDLQFFFNSYNESAINSFIITSTAESLMKRVSLVNLNEYSKINFLLSSSQILFIDELLMRGIVSHTPSNIRLKIQSSNSIILSKHIYYGGSIELDSSEFFFMTSSYFTISLWGNENFFTSSSNAQVMIRNCSFSNFFSVVEGTVFTIDNRNYLVIISSFFNNLISLKSGSLLFGISENKVKFKNCIILSARSLDSGGVISLVYANAFLIDDSIIKEYETVNSGGFLLASENENQIRIFNCSFKNGGASEGTVLFFNYGSKLSIKNTYFFNSTANFDAGSFKFNILNEVLIENSIIHMTASLELSGVLSAFKANKIVVKLTAFMNSLATSVSLFNFKLQNKIVLQEIYILGSISKEYGGAIKLMSQNVILISDVYFYNISFQSSQKLMSISSQNVVYIKRSLFHNSFASYGFASSSNQNILVLKENSYINSATTKMIGGVFELSRSHNYLYFLKTNVFYGEVETFLRSDGANFVEIKFWKIQMITFASFFQLNRNDSLLCRDLFFVLKGSGEKQIVILVGFNFIVNLQNCSIINRSKQSFRLGYTFKSKVRMYQLQVINADDFRIEIPVFAIDFSFFILENSKTVKINYLFNSSFVYLRECLFLLYIHYVNSSLLSYFSDKFNIYTYGLRFIIKSCIFASNKASGSGSIISMNLADQIHVNHFLLILGSIFRNNAALNGGVLRSRNANHVKIKGNIFISNRGIKSKDDFSKGGVFFFQNSQNTNFIQFQGNYYVKNMANIGGILYSEETSTYIRENEFLANNNSYISNYADYYGAILASNIIRFSKIEESSSKSSIKQQLFLKNLVSGKRYDNCLLQISFSDIYSRVAYKTKEDLLKYLIVNTQAPSSSLDIQLLSNEGTLCLKGTFKNYLHNYSNNYSLILMYLASSIEIYYSFRPCEQGEELLEDFSCQYCPENFYSSLMEDATECLLCSSNLPFICYGGNNLTIKNSFWRKSIGSMKIIKCRNINACIGDSNSEGMVSGKTEFNSSYMLSTCAMGYTGPLCGVCEDGFGFESRYKCAKCTDKWFILKMVGFLLMQFGFMALAMYKSLKICRQLFLNNVDERDAITMNMIKIFSGHAQLLIIIFSLDGSSYHFFAIFESNPFNTNMSDNFSIQCIFKALHVEINYLYSKIGITLFSPLICFLFAVTVLKIMMIKHRDSFQNNTSRTMRKHRLMLSDLIESVILIVCALHSPNIIRDVLEMFIFINIEDDRYPKDLRVMADLEIVFDSNMHLNALYFLAIPLLFIFGLLLPFLIFYQVKKKKEEGLLDDQIVRFNYGYFFFSYKEDKLYWEFISNLRKVIIQGIVVAGSSLDSQRKNICFLIILSFLMIFLYMIKENKPYKNEYQVLNKIEECSFFALIVSTFFLIGFSFYIEIDDSIRSSEIGVLNSSHIVVIILILINGVFYTIFLFVYVKYGNLEKNILKFLPLKIRKSRIVEKLQHFMHNLTSRKNSKKNFLASSKIQKTGISLIPVKISIPADMKDDSISYGKFIYQEINSTFFPYIRKIMKKMVRLKMKNKTLRFEVFFLKGEQMDSSKNKFLSQVLPLTENSYFIFYENELLKIKMKIRMISFVVKYTLKIVIKERKMIDMQAVLQNQTKNEKLLIFSKLIFILIKIYIDKKLKNIKNVEKFSFNVHQNNVLDDLQLDLHYNLNEAKIELLFPMPILIKSLLKQNKTSKVKYLPFSFELNKNIDKFLFYKNFMTNYELLKRFLSFLNYKIKKKKDWTYVWTCFKAINDTKILIIFKEEMEAKIEGFLYLHSIRKGNERICDILIQTLISVKGQSRLFF